MCLFEWIAKDVIAWRFCVVASHELEPQLREVFQVDLYKRGRSMQEAHYLFTCFCPCCVILRKQYLASSAGIS